MVLVSPLDFITDVHSSLVHIFIFLLLLLPQNSIIMEGEGTYLKRQSYSSTPSKSYNNYTTSPSQKSQYRYSTGEYSKTSTRISRRYATPEESDAVFPVFNTPINMYLRKELNPQQRYAPTSQQQQQQQQQPVYSSSSTKYHSKPSYSGASFDPLSSKASTASTAS